jgi:hypothetical protein
MSPRTVRYGCGALLVLALSAAAPPKDEEKKTVEVSVVAILATERDNNIDTKLACIARQVRKTHQELTGFQMATMSRKSLSVGAKSIFELIEAQKVGVTVQQGVDEKHRVEVKVSPPGMGEITYDTCCGKFLPIITPYHTKNKELLIIAVCVRGR